MLHYLNIYWLFIYVWHMQRGFGNSKLGVVSLNIWLVNTINTLELNMVSTDIREMYVSVALSVFAAKQVEDCGFIRQLF